MKRNLVPTFGVASLLAVLLLVFIPTKNAEAIKSELRRLTNNPGQLCFDFHRGQGNDLNTAKITDTAASANLLKVNYSRVNVDGTLITGSLECPLLNGEFDQKSAIIVSISLLQEEQAQLEGRVIEISGEIGEILGDETDTLSEAFYDKDAELDSIDSKLSKITKKIESYKDQLI